MRRQFDARRVTVVTDSNVGPLHAARLGESLNGAGFEAVVLTVPAGDASKSLRQAEALYARLAERGHERAEPIIALGGGMVGDLAGFVAATWLRGVPFVQCPTTVEADVDASVGGKTALNHPAGKNLIGCFHQPSLVCIDTDCLGTLRKRDFTAGLAESVKHAVIRDQAFFEWHEANVGAIVAQEPRTLLELVERNCRNKAEVVVADERETAEEGVGRAALNFGHTVGHAIEAQFNYELRHGEAVALGMVAAMDLAVRFAGFAEAERERVEAMLRALGLPVVCAAPLDVDEILRRLAADKKARGRTVRFVVPTVIGRVRWLEAPAVAEVERAISRVLR
jgi:3-dehydroquinate synthase